MQRLEEQRVVRSKIAQDKRDAHVMGVCRRHIGHQRRTSCYLTKQNSLSIKAHECVRVRVRVRVCVRVCVCAYLKKKSKRTQTHHHEIGPIIRAVVIGGAEECRWDVIMMT